MSGVEQRIDAGILRILLRYFRRGEPVVLGSVTPTAADSDFVVQHWAMSSDVERLTKHLLQNTREAEQVVGADRTETSGLARGRIDARATLVAQRRFGDSGRIVSYAPSRHADHGTNRLLVWVLKRASDAIDRVAHMLADGSPYVDRAASIRGAIGRIAHSTPIADLFRTLRLANRPTAGDVRHATKHRSTIYRLAAAAYIQLQMIERGDAAAIASLLHSSLIAPIEPWRRFELLTALAIAQSIAARTSEPLEISILGSSNASRPLARCGRHEIYWQTRTRHYSEPPLEPSEARAAEICEDFGLAWGGDRPDVVVVDTTEGCVVSLAEAKFIGSDLARPDAPFKDGMLQLVRYSRGYGIGVLERSIIAVSRLPSGFGIGKPSNRSPFAIDVLGLLGNGLDAWCSGVDEFNTEAARIAEAD